MNGKDLCLRGGREHKGLKISQFTFGFEDSKEFLEYTKNGSKIHSGSYKVLFIALCKTFSGLQLPDKLCQYLDTGTLDRAIMQYNGIAAPLILYGFMQQNATQDC